MRGSVDRVQNLPASITDSAGDIAVVVLVEEAGAAAQISDRLRTVCSERGRRERVLVASPPHRGVDFFADPDVQATVDAWWGQTIPRDVRPLYLTEHHADLPQWVGGIDGHFYVAVPDPGAAEVYRGRSNVSPIVGAALADDFLDSVLPACGIKPSPRRKPSRGRSTSDQSGAKRFRRARIEAAEEVRSVPPAAPKPAPQPGSEAFFHPTEQPPAGPVEAATPPQVADELIGVLAETLSKLRSLRTPVAAR
jgi:hypothetical protein